jgi:predicted transcriptional regulator
MYSSSLSHAQTKEYLPLLAEKKLLDYHEDSRRYKITRRGQHFLKLYEDVDEMLKVTPTTK